MVCPGEAERLLVFRGPRDVMGIVEIERVARGWWQVGWLSGLGLVVGDEIAFSSWTMSWAVSEGPRQEAYSRGFEAGVQGSERFPAKATPTGRIGRL